MNRYLLEKANANSGKIFKPNPNRPQLQLSIIDKVRQNIDQWALHLKAPTEINRVEELGELHRQTPSECMRIYTIQHVRSWSPLNISRELLDQLLAMYHIFPELWRILLTFGLKSFENEYGFPIPQARESKSDSLEIEELAYVIRRVEQNGRASPACPWSIRQTGVYQKLVHKEDKSQDSNSIFILVAPSSTAESNVIEELDGKTSDSAGAALSVHRCIVAEGLIGWMDYMCWIEERLKIRSTRMMAPPTPGGPERRPIDLVKDDRQELKQLEDYVADMLVILDTKVHSIRRLKTSYQRRCAMRCGQLAQCACARAIHELEEYTVEAQNYQNRARVLQTRVQSVQSLLSDLLGYGEVRTLRELAKASHQESAGIKQLMVHTVNGTTAMEHLAIIGLLFIPTTLVENFFSTEFVKNNGGHIHVSGDVWMMAAVAVPLTICVIALWWFWPRYARPASLAMQRFEMEEEEPSPLGGLSLKGLPLATAMELPIWERTLTRAEN